MEQKAKNQKIKELSKQKETKNQFWKALNEHVTQEVVKINLARDLLNADLATFGRQQKNVIEDKNLVTGRRLTVKKRTSTETLKSTGVINLELNEK